MYTGQKVLMAHYINSMKEAEYMKQGSARRMMSLSKSSELDLWLSVIESIQFFLI